MDDDDSETLLRRYAETGCGDAFAGIMRRHAATVYHAALRNLDGDRAAAEDVVQSVFSDLSRSAQRLPPGLHLAGWLYRAALHDAADRRRTDRRRRHREMAAAEERKRADETGCRDEESAKVNAALSKLSQADREALLLRYFEDRPLRDVGGLLGLSEDAAQKRISRALQRLRRLLRPSGRGEAATGTVIASLCQAPKPPPPSPDVFRAVRFPLSPPPPPPVLTLFHAAMNSRHLAAASLVLAAGAGCYVWLRDRPDASPSRPHAALSAPTATSAPSSPKTHGKSTPDSVIAADPEANRSESASASAAEERAAPPATGDPRSEGSVRQRAEEVTLERFHEKMERLDRKLLLTPAQHDQLAAWHLAQREKWIAYLADAAFHRADPQYYSLEAGYREDVPPDIQSSFTPEQARLYQDHDANKRTNHIEAVTSGEINYLAQRLDLDPARKDALFDALSQINVNDLFTDLTGVHDLDAIAAQADRDVQRRREAFGPLLDAEQLTLWEGVVADYRRDLLRRFGAPDASALSAGSATDQNADARAG